MLRIILKIAIEKVIYFLFLRDMEIIHPFTLLYLTRKIN